MKTSYIRLLATLSLAATSLQIVGVSASTIGTGTVVGSGALTTPINWNDTFVGSSASGTINGIVVTARILPTLNMSISGSGTMNLGNISSAATATGTVSIEVGTNAINGASVTASSTNAGMVNTTNSGTVLNNLTADGFADSYRFISSNGTVDSTAPGFTQTANLNAEVNSTAAQTIYTSNRPQPLSGVNDFNFSVTVLPNGQTPAGDYRDVVRITVTGNF